MYYLYIQKDRYEMIETAIEELKKEGTLEKGDTLVIAGARKDENTADLGKIINL